MGLGVVVGADSGAVPDADAAAASRESGATAASASETALDRFVRAQASPSGNAPPTVIAFSPTEDPAWTTFELSRLSRAPGIVLLLPL